MAVDGSKSHEPEGGRARALARAADHVFGAEGGIAGAVYGTIVIMATVAVAYATEKDPWRLAVLVATTAFVLWIAHLYAHALSESITENRRLTKADVTSIARRERGILLAAAGPAAALGLGALGVVREATAVWLALGIGLVTLGAEGLRYARLEALGRAGTVAAIAVNLALGLVIVALKVVVAH